MTELVDKLGSPGDISTKKTKRRKNEPIKTAPARAEKSRSAAKARRDKEQVELDILIELLPFDNKTLAKVDKTNIIQLALGYIQTKQFVKEGLQEITNNVQTMTLSTGEPEAAVTEAMKAEEGRLMMEALDGFLIFVGKNGRICFVSEQVEKHVGLSVINLMSMNVLDFIHNEDHKEFLSQFQDDNFNQTVNQRNLALMDVSDFDDCTGSQGSRRERVFYARIKCHLPKPGTKTKQFSHLLAQWSGRLQCRPSPQGGDSGVVGLVAVVRPVHAEPIVEIRLDGNMFMSRHDLSMRFTFCDPRILNLIGYVPEELMGKTSYQFHYPTDAPKLHICHKSLIAKGTCVSKYYRFLGKTGQWVWMKTRATIINTTGNDPQYVVCLNYVYSDEEGKRCLLLERGQGGCNAESVQGFIDIKSLGFNDDTARNQHNTEPNNNNLFTPEDCTPKGSSATTGPQVVGSNNCVPTHISANSGTSVSVPVSEAVLDHTYPVTSSSSGTVPHCGDLPAGLAASGFPQLVQQNFFDNTPAGLEQPEFSSWLDDLTAALNSDPPVATELNLNETMASTTTMVNRDYRLAVSDHDYSAKPELEGSGTSARNNDTIFSNSEGMLLDGLDEMMDTDFLDTVSFGRTNYEDVQSQNSLLNGEGILGTILSKSGLSLSDDLDETSSLLEAIGEGSNGLLRGSMSAFPSDHTMASDGMLSTSDSFAAKFAESLIDDEVKGISYSLGQTDPCLGVTSLQHVATSAITKNGHLKNVGLEQNLNQHTLGLVDTPPPSPKPVRSNVKPQYRRQGSLIYASPVSSPPTIDLSASFSGGNSSQRSSSSSSSSSSTSPTGNLSLNKSWPNTSKSSRGRNNAGSSSSSGANRNRSSNGGHHRANSHPLRHTSGSEHKHKSPAPTLLEQFLTTKQRINPNRGSDNVFHNSRVTERISRLQIDKAAEKNGAERDPNLLQQLLTGAIDDKRAHQYDRRRASASKGRRKNGSQDTTPLTSPITSPITSPLTSPLVSDIDLDSESLTPDNPSLNLFDSGTADMGNFFGPLSPDVDILMHSDLDDILREQSRQEELWLREYVS